MTENFKINLSELGTKLRKARESNKLIRPDAAKLLNISKSTLQAWENGEREPSISQLCHLVNVYNITLSSLLTDNKTPLPIENNHDNEFVYVPRYNIQVSAGHGAWSDNEQSKRSMAFCKYWLDNNIKARKEDLSVITVKGDSMEGVLNDRDLILINHADKDPREGIYVLRIDDHLIVKQLQRLPDSKIKVVSSNTHYDPFVIDLKKPPVDFEIIGRVVWFGRTI